MSEAWQYDDAMEAWEDEMCDRCGGRGQVDYFDRQRLVEDEMPCPSCSEPEVR